jgi:hypothetical protein
MRSNGSVSNDVTRFDGKIRLLAACLSALAGFVDALAFLKLGGFAYESQFHGYYDGRTAPEPV